MGVMRRPRRKLCRPFQGFTEMIPCLPTIQTVGYYLSALGGGHPSCTAHLGACRDQWRYVPHPISRFANPTTHLIQDIPIGIHMMDLFKP